MKTYKAELYCENKYALGESPCFDEKTGTIAFTDITAGMFYRISGGEITGFDLGEQIGACVLGKDGSYILCATTGLYRFTDGKAERFFEFGPLLEPWQRCNDCKAGPLGRIFMGTSSYMDGYEGGNLYLYDGGLKILVPDTKIANGMAWFGDNFYFADSTDKCVYRFNYYPSGAISGREVLFTVSGGFPDGLCVDSDGNLFVAIWGGNRIEHRDGSTGKLLGVIEVPAVNVTSCCFIGDKKLFITTSGMGLDGELDGCLFTCEVEASKGPLYLAG